MTPAAVGRAVAALVALRHGVGRAAIRALPPDCRPQTIEDAYRIQDALRSALPEAGAGAARGWKIGCTTPVMQRYLAIDFPCAGSLYGNGIHHGSATLHAADYLTLGLECEIAVRLRHGLSGEESREELTAALAGVMTSVEIVEHRFSHFTTAGAPSLIADDFFSAGCVLGAAIDPAAAGDLARLEGGFTLDGEPVGGRGSGATILGHPLQALRWLARHLARNGGGLAGGALVTLGSVVKTLYPERPCRVVASFDGLGCVTVDVR